jgi:hypothetical protein
MERDATRAVEQLSGRRVRAFTSANHLDADIAVEIFVLEPLGKGAGEHPRELDRVTRLASRRRGD